MLTEHVKFADRYEEENEKSLEINGPLFTYIVYIPMEVHIHKPRHRQKENVISKLFVYHAVGLSSRGHRCSGKVTYKVELLLSLTPQFPPTHPGLTGPDN